MTSTNQGGDPPGPPGPPPRPVLITTDLDRTLLFSRRATAQLGGGLPADPLEPQGAELSRAARDCLAGLPPHARLCVATSRSVSRLARLRLPFATPYAIAANGGVVLIDGTLDRGWAARIEKVMAAAAPAVAVRAVLAGSAEPSGPGDASWPDWLIRMGDTDDMCCMAIVDLTLFSQDELAAIARRCGELGWEASLIGRKLYAFPIGFGKEHAAAYVAERIAALSGVFPERLAAGDTEHDRQMLAAADLAWVPAGSALAAASPAGGFLITRDPGHAGAAQITADWLAHCGDAVPAS